MNMLLNKAQVLMSQGNFGAANLYFAEHEKAKTRPEMETDPAKAFKNIQSKNTGFFGVNNAVVSSDPISAKMQKFRFGTDLFKIKGFDQTHKGTQRGEIMNQTGVDIGNIANVIDKNDAIRIANLQRTLSQFNQPTPGMTGGRSGGRADLAIAAVGGNATAAYQVKSVNWAGKAAWKAKLALRDSNENRLRWGGTLVPGKTIEDEGAVMGGYSSASAYRRASKLEAYRKLDEATGFLSAFGVERIKTSYPKSDARRALTRMPAIASNYRSTLAAAGMSYKTLNPLRGSRISAQRLTQYNSYKANVLAYNQNQFAKAQEINTLQQGFGLEGFTGSALDLSALQDRIVLEEERMKSIGLTRTEVFQIVDTSGRGREEIDDRIRFKDRLNNISTGTTVL
jgi:hypothetical protein